MGLSDSAPLPRPRTAHPPRTSTCAPTVPHVVGARVQFLPDLGDLFEVLTDAGVPDVAAALDASAGERQVLDLGVVELQQRIDIPSPDGLEGQADYLDVLL